MRETEAQAVLLVKAFEEADIEGQVLSLAERSAPLEAGAGGIGGFEATLARRAAGLLQRLEEHLPRLPRLLRTTRLGAGLAPALIVTALILGLLSNYLGPQRHINVLSFPLLSLIAWNLGVYVLLAFQWWRSKLSAPSRRPERNGLARILSEAYGQLFFRRWESSKKGEAGILAGALGRFLSQWRRVAGPLIEARARRLLHLGAAALATGAVAGMYIRGLAFEYRATWESTFLGPEQAQTLLEAVLWPAHRLLDVPLPDLELLRAPREGEAALWVHLYALSALLYIAVPRLLLAAVAAMRCRRLARNLPLDLSAPYFRRAAAWAGSRTSRVRVLPYSIHPPPGFRQRLAAQLVDVLGCRVEVDVAEAVEYGTELQEIEPSEYGLSAHGGGDAYVLVLFSLSQTPETEVHGRILHQLRQRLAPSGQVLVAVTASEFRARMGEIGAPERVQERRRSWDRVVASSGLEAIHLDLETADGGESAQALTDNLGSEAVPKGER